MTAILSYDISVTGLRNIDAAFAHIERRAKQANASIARQGATARTGGAAGGTAVKSEESMRAASEARIAKIRERSAARIAKLERDAALSTEKAREAARLKAERAAARHQERMRRIDEASEARKRLRAEEATRRLAADDQRRKFRAEEAIARKKLNDARKANEAAAASLVAGKKKFAGTVGNAAIGSAVGIGRSAIGAAALGGTAIVGLSIAKQMSAEKAATNLANKAFGIPGETRTREEIKGDIMARATEVGRVSGDRAGAIEAIDKFVAISGSLKGGSHLAEFMANISAATGASMEDVGRTGGQILQNVVATKGRNLANPEDFAKSMKDVESIMLAMAGQAKIGSIEFADLATQMGKVMSATSRFSGNVDDLANQMGAIGQLAIAGGASSPEEAMTAIMRFSDDLISNAGRFDAMRAQTGIKESFFTDKGKTKLRDPTSIMMDVLRVTKGDLQKVSKLFGIRAMKAVEPFQQAYVSAREAGMSEEDALSQVQTTIDRFKGAKMTGEEMRGSAAFARSQSGAQLKIAWEDLTMTMGQELIPVVKELVPSIRDFMLALKDLAPAVKSVAEWFSQNPFRGIGLLVGGKIVADIAAAAIGEKVSSALVGAIARASGVQAAGTAGGAMSAVPAVTGAAGVAAGAAGMALAGVAAAGTEAMALHGLLAEKGGPVKGANDITAGSVINFMTGGLAGALGSLAGGGGAKGAIGELSHVKAARFLLGDQLTNTAIESITGGPQQYDLSKVKSSAELKGGPAQPVNQGPIGDLMAGATAKQEKAAEASAAAALKLSQAADALQKSATGLNRGNAPTPAPAVK